MLLLNPCGIERRRKCRDSCLAERRGCVPAKQLAQSFELQHSLGAVDERLGHRSLCYRKGVRQESSLEAKETAAGKRARREQRISRSARLISYAFAPADCAAYPIAIGRRKTKTVP